MNFFSAPKTLDDILAPLSRLSEDLFNFISDKADENNELTSELSVIKAKIETNEADITRAQGVRAKFANLLS